jgi:hypothetical protein
MGIHFRLFRKNVLSFFFILLTVPAFSLQIEGNVYNRKTKEAVSTAFVLLKSGTNVIQAVQVNSSGHYRLENLEKGTYNLEVRSSGYLPEIRAVQCDQNLGVTFYMTRDVTYSLGEVEVVGERDKVTVSRDVIDKETRQDAVTSITGDPLAILTQLPGVQSVSGGGLGGVIGKDRDASGFSVRGGSGLENLALLDGMLIDHPYHTIFPDSVFIDELVDQLALYKGVVPPRYGQAMSSILDVGMVDGKDGFHGKLNLGLLNLYLTLDGATADGKWSFVGGIRRTQYDLVGMLLLNVIAPGVDTTTVSLPYYLDSQGKVQYKDKNDLMELTWFYSDEPTKVYFVGSNSNSNGGTGFRSAAMNLSVSAENSNPEASLDLHWKHIFENNLSLEQFVQGTYSYAHQELYFSNSTDTSSNSISSYENSWENNLRYKAMFNIGLFPDNVFRPGVEALIYPDLNYTNVFNQSSTNTNTLTGRTSSLDSGFEGKLGVYSAFMEDEASLFDNRVSVLGGLRLNYYDFDNAFSLDPRITVQYELLKECKVYGAWGYMSQFPTDPVILSSLETNRSDVPVPGCYQYVLGSQWKVIPSALLTAEVYYKDYINDIEENTNSQTTYVTTSGLKNVYGYELVWTQRAGDLPVHGWIGLGGDYVRQYNDESPTNLSKNSPMYPTNQWYVGDDGMNYKLDITAIWQINKNWTVTAGFNLQAGSPYTPVVGATSTNKGTNTIYTPIFGVYNSSNLPAYHTLDLKVENRGDLFNIPYGLYVEAQDIYNDLQVTGYSYSQDYTTRREQKALLGIIPSIGFWIEW